MSDLRDLYQEVILDHSKRPRNFEALEDTELKAEGYSFVTVSELLGNRIKWAVPGSPELP